MAVAPVGVLVNAVPAVVYVPALLSVCGVKTMLHWHDVATLPVHVAPLTPVCPWSAV